MCRKAFETAASLASRSVFAFDAHRLYHRAHAAGHMAAPCIDARMLRLSTDSASPADDFIKSEVPYVRLDDVQVATDWLDLVDGTLEAPIIVSELGGPPAASTHVCIPQDAWGAWTSTNEAGLPAMWGTCDNWTSTVGDSSLGRVGDASLAWSFFCVTPCSSKASLYCVEQ